MFTKQAALFAAKLLTHFEAQSVEFVSALLRPIIRSRGSNPRNKGAARAAR